MTIGTNDKTLLLLGNDVLTENSLFVFLEAIDFKIKSQTIDPKNLKILIDTSIYNEIERLGNAGKRQEFIRIKGIITILKALGIYDEIDTAEFREFDTFIKLLESNEGFKLMFITDQKSYAAKCNLEKKDTPVELLKFDGDNLVTWDFNKTVNVAPTVSKEPVKKVAAKTEPKETVVNKPIKEEVKKPIKVKAPHKLQEAFFTTPKDGLVSITDEPDYDYVYSEMYGFLELDKDNVMFGGEGKIYRTYENLLVKIYSKDERRYETIKKIQLLIDMDLRNKFIVWPKDIVYNNNEFVGYLMEEILDAKGLDMYRIYSFQNIPYKERFKVCIDLLKMIEYLHSRNILVGDLKFDNILYTNKSKELYIIDSGSFQLEDYSCGVFNAAYTHDNLKGINLREVLRTLEEEYFPINKILFEILMGKGPFYDFKSGEVGAEVARNFHYPMEVSKAINNQQDPLYFWTNSDERLRYAFYDYFAKGIITEVDQWINLLEDILYKGAR